MKADTCIRYLDVLAMSVGGDDPSGGRNWTDKERQAYYGLLRHFRAAQKREKASK